MCAMKFSHIYIKEMLPNIGKGIQLSYDQGKCPNLDTQLCH